VVVALDILQQTADRIETDTSSSVFQHKASLQQAMGRQHGRLPGYPLLACSLNLEEPPAVCKLQKQQLRASMDPFIQAKVGTCFCARCLEED